jgi:hypothetical protein
MHEMAWQDWINGEETAAWLDRILLNADNDRIIRLFIYIILEGVSESVSRTYQWKDAMAIDFFTRLAGAAVINYDALKPDLNLDNEENEDYDDEEEEYDEDDDLVLEDEESES